ncbi:cytochrome c553 [Hoeflea halophila]|uniref:Cytochrome c553 n=1 Tax=Hoeflea halophila TaxID=714899 RepID=A0A286I0S5_9HYPH|nr:c-type cytochrome [Hoeflea halophila]SOE13326.1 cytochrome c553 [Hoeflea halophila]
MVKRHVLTSLMILLGVLAWTNSYGSNLARADETETAIATDDVDLEAAEKIFKKSCRACHGNKAQGAASYPKLSHLEPDYIAEKLEIYRSGEKIGPNSILMIQPAKKLSDEDIANISVYVATAFD